MEMLRISCVPVGYAIQFTVIIHAFVWDNCYAVSVLQPIKHISTNTDQKNASCMPQLHYSCLPYDEITNISIKKNHKQRSGDVFVFLPTQSGSVVIFYFEEI